MTETCRMCAVTQIINGSQRKVPRMYRTGDGAVQCSDPYDCLARRRELIAAMQRGLDQVWRFLDEIAVRAGWPR
jgi:hypothetical protein